MGQSQIKIDKLDFVWTKSYCSISKPATSELSPYDYEEKEFEYIDFLINDKRLGNILQIEGKTIGYYTRDCHHADTINDLLPVITKSREVTLYDKPIGENIYDWYSIVCNISINDQIVTWSNFGIPNTAWTEPIDFLRPFNFDINQYSDTLNKINLELVTKTLAKPDNN